MVAHSSSSNNSSFKKSTSTEKSIKDKKKKEHIPKYSNPHMIIPNEDMEWSMNQKHSVVKLWRECWLADPYGSRMMQLNTKLPYSTFMQAKKVIADAGLFVFKPESSLRDGRETVYWQVQNLHGSRVKSYWQKLNSSQLASNSSQSALNSSQPTSNYGGLESISSQILTQQAFPDPSVTPQKHLSNSSKELLRCAEISASKESGTDSAKESPKEKLIALALGQGNPDEDLGLPQGDQELLGHLEAAREGIMPTKEVLEKLRDSQYWVELMSYALTHKWKLQPLETTITPGAKQLLEQLKAKKKKPWLQ